MVGAAAVFVAALLPGCDPQAAPGVWQRRAPNGLPRGESSFVRAGNHFFLAGIWGSSARRQEAYDPRTNSWRDVAPLPAALHHIQSVTLGGLVYYVGGLPFGGVRSVYVYNPATNRFGTRAPLPPGRGRGAGGVAVHNGKIYYAGGLHQNVAVPWFDVYDPATNTWRSLPDMPRPRDHFQAAIVGGKLWALGGRHGRIESTYRVSDAFDFSTGRWTTGYAPIPTPRGGYAVAVLGREILVIGGEGGGRAHDEVEAYDTGTNRWRALARMPTPRHGISAAVCNGGVYVASGFLEQGAGPTTNVHEVFFLDGARPCPAAGA